MRAIHVSQSYVAALNTLLAYGEQKFGTRVVDEKRERVARVIRDTLSLFPGVGRFDTDLNIHYFGVDRTPFVLLYDYDELELRIHLVIHRRSDRKRVDLADIQW